MAVDLGPAAIVFPPIASTTILQSDSIAIVRYQNCNPDSSIIIPSSGDRTFSDSSQGILQRLGSPGNASFYTEKPTGAKTIAVREEKEEQRLRRVIISRRRWSRQRRD
jgi:hypothetical protein